MTDGYAPAPHYLVVTEDDAQLVDRDELEQILERCTEHHWYVVPEQLDMDPIAVCERTGTDDLRTLTLQRETVSSWWTGLCERWTLTTVDGEVVDRIETTYDRDSAYA